MTSRQTTHYQQTFFLSLSLQFGLVLIFSGITKPRHFKIFFIKELFLEKIINFEGSNEGSREWMGVYLVKSTVRQCFRSVKL